MIIEQGNRLRNSEATKFAVKYAYERSKVKYPVYINLAEAKFEIKSSADFL